MPFVDITNAGWRPFFFRQAERGRDGWSNQSKKTTK